jgi:uncharacterized MAPEG superfamily protein
VIVAHLAGAANEATTAAAIAYFWVRAAHYVLYSAGVPVGRTIAMAVVGKLMPLARGGKLLWELR